MAIIIITSDEPSFTKTITMKNNFKILVMAIGRRKNFLIMKMLLTFFFGGIVVFSFGQNISKNTFKKTNWFVNNKDSSFYKSDTIHLIKRIIVQPKRGHIENLENEMELLNTGDFVEIRFYRNGDFGFCEIHDNNKNILWIVGGKWTWNVISEKNLLEIREHKKVYWTFKFLNEKIIQIKSDELLTTTEITLIRIK